MFWTLGSMMDAPLVHVRRAGSSTPGELPVDVLGQRLRASGSVSAGLVEEVVDHRVVEAAEVQRERAVGSRRRRRRRRSRATSESAVDEEAGVVAPTEGEELGVPRRALVISTDCSIVVCVTSTPISPHVC